MALNPLRSEAEAFRVFLWVLGGFAVVIVVVVVVRAGSRSRRTSTRRAARLRRRGRTWALLTLK